MLTTSSVLYQRTNSSPTPIPSSSSSSTMAPSTSTTSATTLPSNHRRPSISHVISFLKSSSNSLSSTITNLNVTSASTSSTQLQTPQTASTNINSNTINTLSKSIRISEPVLVSDTSGYFSANSGSNAGSYTGTGVKTANTHTSTVHQRYGALGSGATVVRTPFEALSGAAGYYAQNQVGTRSQTRIRPEENELPPSPPDSPPLPPVPFQDDEEEEGGEEEEGRISWKSMTMTTTTPKSKHHSPPPSRPIPPPPPIIEPESIPLPVTPNTSPRKQLLDIRNSNTSNSNSTIAVSCSSYAVQQEQQEEQLQQQRCSFSPLLLPTSSITNNISTLDTSCIIVSIEISDKTLKTTLGTILTRESRLAEWLRGVVASAGADADGYAVKTVNMANEDSEVNYAYNNDEDDSIYSQVDSSDVHSDADADNDNDNDDVNDTLSFKNGFTSIFQNHLIKTGVIPVPNPTVSAKSISSAAVTSAGIKYSTAHIDMFLDRNGTSYPYILAYLRSNTDADVLEAIGLKVFSLTKGTTNHEIQMYMRTLLSLRDEASYLGMEELSDVCAGEIERMRRDHVDNGGHMLPSTTNTNGVRHSALSGRTLLRDDDNNYISRPQTTSSLPTPRSSASVSASGFGSASVPGSVSHSGHGSDQYPGLFGRGSGSATGRGFRGSGMDASQMMKNTQLHSGRSMASDLDLDLDSRARVDSVKTMQTRTQSHRVTNSTSTINSVNINNISPPPADILKQRLLLRARAKSAERGVSVGGNVNGDVNGSSSSWHTMKARPVGEWI